MTLSSDVRKLGDAVLAIVQKEVAQDLRGLLLAGSRIHGTVDANSDLDVLAVWTRPVWQKRSFYAEGTPVDLVLAPWEYYDAMLARVDAPGSIAMFAMGEAFYDPDGIVAALGIRARDLYSARVPSPQYFWSFLFRHRAWSLLQDLKDSRADEQAGFRYMLGICIEFFIDAYLRVHGEWRVDHKQRYRALRERHAAIWSQLRTIIEAGDEDAAIRTLETLFANMLSPFGGLPATGATPLIDWRQALRIF